MDQHTSILYHTYVCHSEPSGTYLDLEDLFSREKRSGIAV